MSVVAPDLGSGQTLPLLTRLLSSARAGHRSENTDLLSVMETVQRHVSGAPLWVIGRGGDRGRGRGRRQGERLIQAYLDRWACEEGYRFTKQGFQLEGVQARRQSGGTSRYFPYPRCLPVGSGSSSPHDAFITTGGDDLIGPSRPSSPTSLLTAQR